MSHNVTDGNLFSGLGNMITGNLDWERNKELLAMEQVYNMTEADRNRDWQEYMSNTAYTRATKELEQLGLNPYYILSSGGASTPSGSSASSSANSFRTSTKGFDLLGGLINLAVMLGMQGTNALRVAEKQGGNALKNAQLQSETALKTAKLQSETALKTAKLYSTPNVRLPSRRIGF